MPTHLQGFILIISLMVVAACSDEVILDFTDRPSHIVKMNPEFSMNGPSINPNTGFFDQPLSCDARHSTDFYCDGFAPLKSYHLPDSPRINAENFTTNFPPSNFVGMQVLGDFDHRKPTIIYIHGWNRRSASASLGMPDTWVLQAQAANFNTLYFHWYAESFDAGEGCPGLGVFGGINTPCNASYDIFRKNGIVDIFISEYQKIFNEQSAPVRIVGHSLGTNLAIFASYLMHIDPSLNQITRPTRIDLIDPFVSPGLGSSRDKPYDGQIPRDRQLSSLYKENIVTDFNDGSACHDDWIIFIPPNHLSQYCQLEGMIYTLIKEHSVPTLILSSVVSNSLAKDFSKVGVFQAFSGSAFKGEFQARHSGPLAAYMYSFAVGEPQNGYDASSDDRLIRKAAYAQAIHGINVSVKQTSGFDTISLLDDEFHAANAP